jgi:hypothetical protein
VLARRDNDRLARPFWAELGQVYCQRVAQLRQVGVEPGQVISWRQRLILAAQSVTQLGRALSIDDPMISPEPTCAARRTTASVASTTRS